MRKKATALRPPGFQREYDSAVRGLRDAEGVFRSSMGCTFPEAVTQITVGRQWLEGAGKKLEEADTQIEALSVKIDNLNRLFDSEIQSHARTRDELQNCRSLAAERDTLLCDKLDDERELVDKLNLIVAAQRAEIRELRERPLRQIWRRLWG